MIHERCGDGQTDTQNPNPAIKTKKNEKTKALNWSKSCANAHDGMDIHGRYCFCTLNKMSFQDIIRNRKATRGWIIH